MNFQGIEFSPSHFFIRILRNILKIVQILLEIVESKIIVFRGKHVVSDKSTELVTKMNTDNYFLGKGKSRFITKKGRTVKFS